jgi:hypothetical protein
MKNRILALMVIAFSTLSLSKFTNDTDCNTFYPLHKGYEWIYNDYNKKDKLESINSTTVVDVSAIDGGTEYKIKAKSESAKPKKDEKPFERTFSYFCKNGILNLDLSSMLPPEYKDMDVTIEQKNITIPSTLKPGQILDDAQMTAYLNGMQIMKIDITDRKCEKFETVETEAGSFECALISSKTTSKMAFLTILGSDKQWFSPKVGLVKSESFDKNNVKQSSRKLVKFSTGK